jgi:hypothetical protein
MSRGEHTIDHNATGDEAFISEQEKDLHSRAILKLAEELQLPADDIRPSYLKVLAKLRKDARIRAFLPVLVSRSVKEQIQQQ